MEKEFLTKLLRQQLEQIYRHKEPLGQPENYLAKIVPSIIKRLTLELKLLLRHLKYGYLGDNNTATGLPVEQEKALLEVLKTHRKAIGWTISYIKGICLILCQHKVGLKERSQ
ncbi:hypothetical protein EPI10_000883 [Gossypium australe]|uniref:Uncharacterized protein n=1 Tax=Gossypium australe TaxID=47621 RepID=A0A5B6V973_9ROSI|nr:hypothetical protein EPI10_000883 [Gossypium australe]